MVAAEKVAEKILGDLLTEVLDLVHVIHKYRVGYADLLLTSIGILTTTRNPKSPAIHMRPLRDVLVRLACVSAAQSKYPGQSGDAAPAYFAISRRAGAVGAKWRSWFVPQYLNQETEMVSAYSSLRICLPRSAQSVKRFEMPGATQVYA